MEFQRLKNPLTDDQYYKDAQIKKFIFLHHTCGYSAQSSIQWWNSKPDRIATPFIIDRDGSCYENFDPKYWSFALGVKGGTWIEKASIHIEIVSLGALSKDEDKFFFKPAPTSKKEVPPEEVLTFPEPYRGDLYYHKYTDGQIASIKALLPELVEEFKIQVQPSVKDFWLYKPNPTTSMLPGIWSHTTVRTDKSDIMPQPELIQAIYDLYPHS